MNIRDRLQKIFDNLGIREGEKMPDTAGEFRYNLEQAIIPFIEQTCNEVIGEENEHSKDMPVPDPDPFALPQDHQNQLRRFQRKHLKQLMGGK